LTIHLDTSALIDVARRPQPLLAAFRRALKDRHVIKTSTIALYEWLRGPRHVAELELQRALCPDEEIVNFGAAEAAVAADLYRRLTRARGRDMDIAIAACAIAHRAALWTTNVTDFRDIPGLRLYQP